MEKKKQQAKQTRLFDDDTMNRMAEQLRSFQDKTEKTFGTIETDFPTAQDFAAYVDEKNIYLPVPCDSLYQRGKEYYKRNIEQIEPILRTSGLTETTIEAIKQDYFFALTGNYDFKAEPTQMGEAWAHLTQHFPYIFQIDRYGFYYVLMYGYYAYSTAYFSYYDEYMNGNEESRKDYLDRILHYSPLQDRGYLWLCRKGIPTPIDFIDKGFEFTLGILTHKSMTGVLMDYNFYYLIAKYALLATPAELDSIRKPLTQVEGFNDETLEAEAIKATDVIFGLLNKKAEKYAATADSSKTESEREEAIQAAQKPIGLRDEIKLPVNFNRANQKPIQAGFDWADERTYMPLTKYIMNVWPNTENGIKYTGVTVTEYTIQKAIEGLGILTNWERMKRNKIEGRLEIPTNISQFAELCLQRDASAVEKKQMLAALLLISNIYVVIDRPVRIKASSSKSKKPVKTGGRTFVKLMTLEEFNIGGNENMIITIPEKSLGGTLLPVSRKDYDRMRKEVKGSQKLRFMANILEMDNRAEDGLVDDCFGFAQLIENAQTEEDRKATREYVRKNRTSAKKKVKQWFEEYLQEGYITSYTYTQNKKGAWVYKWKRGDKKPIEVAEIVEAETVSLPAPNQA